MKIATLGPKGTFSHEAVLKYKPNASLIFKKTIWDIFDAVEKGEAEQSVVPLENSISGTIGYTLDALMEFELNISSEIILPIHHHLAGKGTMKDIKTIFTHSQTFVQCKKFVRKHFKDVEIRETSSNASSAIMIADKNDPSNSAIISDIAAKEYGIEIIKKNIQDNQFNITRFVVISSEDNKPTGNDRTSMAIYPQADKPGLLHEMLGSFAKRKINLSKIESRPSKGKLGDYIFFIEVQGHRKDKKIQEALKEIENKFLVKVLGSYPRAY